MFRPYSRSISSETVMANFLIYSALASSTHLNDGADDVAHGDDAIDLVWVRSAAAARPLKTARVTHCCNNHEP